MPKAGIKHHAVPNAGTEQHAVPNTDITQHAVPNADIKQHTVPSTGIKQRAVPNAAVEQHAVPNTGVKQHAIASMGVKQHAVLKPDHEYRAVNGATSGADAAHQPGQPAQTTGAHLDLCSQHPEGTTQTSSASFDTTLGAQLPASAHNSVAVAQEQAEEQEVRPDRLTGHQCERAVTGRFELVIHGLRLPCDSGFSFLLGKGSGQCTVLTLPIILRDQTEQHVWQGIWGACHCHP